MNHQCDEAVKKQIQNLLDEVCLVKRDNINTIVQVIGKASSGMLRTGLGIPTSRKTEQF